MAKPHPSSQALPLPIRMVHLGASLSGSARASPQTPGPRIAQVRHPYLVGTPFGKVVLEEEQAFKERTRFSLTLQASSRVPGQGPYRLPQAAWGIAPSGGR